MKRCYIRVGDPTTAGGTVITGSPHDFLFGPAQSLDGDLINCPACGQQGTIHCIGPHQNETSYGRHVALEGDLCICGCSPPPTLIPTQFTHGHIVEGFPSAIRVPNNFDEYFIVHDQGTGKPISANFWYQIKMDDDEFSGETDDQGVTEKLGSDEQKLATLQSLVQTSMGIRP